MRGGAQGHPEHQAPASVQGCPQTVPHSQAIHIGSSVLTSSTTRPSGCPSAPTSRYTSGFRGEEEDASLAPLLLQARAAERRSGAERGLGSKPSRRGPQRSASIADLLGSGNEAGRENRTAKVARA
jgi:hypothetical protein